MPDFPVALGEYAALLRARDLDCTVKLAGFVLSRFQQQQLFHNIYAPSGVLLANLAAELAINGSAIPDGLLGETLLQLDRMMVGFMGEWFEQVPIHPVVAAGYHLTWHDPAARYRWRDNGWGFEDYMLSYVRWDTWTV